MNNKIDLKETMYTHTRHEYTNEYIKEINESLKEDFNIYNAQVDRVQEIWDCLNTAPYGHSDEELLKDIQLDIPKEITEEELRETYNREIFLGNSNISYEDYKKDVLALRNAKINNQKRQKLAEKRQELIEKSNRYTPDDYLANAYLLEEIRRPIIGKLVRKSMELEDQLKNCQIELNDKLHEMQRPSISGEAREKLRVECIKLSKQVTNLEYAISLIKNQYQLIAQNKKDVELLRNGLNPIAQKKYEDLVKQANQQNQVETEYDKALADYKSRLETYKNKLSEYDQVKQDFELGKISEEQYQAATNIILAEYEKIDNHYNFINDLYEKEIEKGNTPEAPEAPIEPNSKGKKGPSDYEESLAEYKAKLEEYKHNLKLFEQVKEGLKEGKYTKEQYDKAKEVISAEYEQISESYNLIKGLYEEEVEKGNSPEEPEKPEKPIYNKKEKIEKKRFNKSLVLRTLASIAAGIGIGAAVWFSANALGVVALAVGYQIAASVANIAIHKWIKPKAKTLEQLKIETIKPAKNKLHEAARKVKNYFKSKEGLEAISKALTTSIITIGGIGVAARLISGFIPNAQHDSVPIEQSSNSGSSNYEPTSDSSTIRLGESIEGHEPVIGYDKADWAIDNTNQETLIQSIVNGDNAKFGGFRAIDSNGQAVYSTTPGQSLSDFADLVGVPESNVAINVTDKLGNPLAWVSSDELGASVGGMTK